MTIMIRMTTAIFDWLPELIPEGVTSSAFACFSSRCDVFSDFFGEWCDVIGTYFARSNINLLNIPDVLLRTMAGGCTGKSP